MGRLTFLMYVRWMRLAHRLLQLYNKKECYKQGAKNDKVRNDSKRVSYTQHISHSRKI